MNNTFTLPLKSRLIYVFAIADKQHAGCLKIGETTLGDVDLAFTPPNSPLLNEAARTRIDQYTKTAGISYELLPYATGMGKDRPSRISRCIES